MTLWLPGKVNRRAQLSVPLFNEILAGTGRFDVTGIPPGFGTIQGRLFARTSQAVTGDTVYILFNGDSTAANYRQGQHYFGSATSNAANDAPILGTIPGASATADYFGIIDFIIPRYSSAFYKILRSTGAERRDATNNFGVDTMIHWESTAVINQITVQPDGYATDTFVAGSWLQLWMVP